MMVESERKLVVGVLLNRLFEWSQNFITRELLELKRQGVDVHVCARKIVERDDLTVEERTLQDHFIRVPENPFKPVHLWAHIEFLIKSPLKYIRAWAHCLSFGHRKPSNVGRGVVCLFRAVAIADTVLAHEIDLIHAHFMTAPTETALFLSVLTGIPFGCTAHAMDIYQDNSGMQKKLDRASYVITETRANVAYFGRHWRVGSDRIHQVYNSLSWDSQIRQAREPHRPFVFLAVGRLVPKKGFEYLIEACKLLKSLGHSFSCKIVGKGPLEDTLTRLADSLEVSDVVQFVGYVPPNRMRGVYEAGDALVMPSIVETNGDRDGLPTVCIEAMAHGLPLVCTNVSGLPECILEGENGRTVPPEDASALAGAMADVMSSEHYQTMSENSFTLGLERFDCKKNVARIRTVMLDHVGHLGAQAGPA